jgi:N-sulfoglucosamine sulfohydrolase
MLTRRTALSTLASPLILSAAPSRPRPNFLWVSCEDTGTQIGCYGDKQSLTPNIDRLASQGVRYWNAHTNAGVCAPSRSGIITGMYPTTLGSGFMRCRAKLPPEVKAFPEYLREAGYYCTNNLKTDYNFEVPRNAWDVNGREGHWRNRGKDQPFFSVFNIETTHESRVRARGADYDALTKRLTASQRRDPAAMTLPPYYPDVPEVRRDWANYYELITAMDYQVGDRLKQLEDDGLLEDTIVFFWGDHGVGLPRSKRWLYESSTRVPLVARIPEKFRHGGVGKPGSVEYRLLSMIDLAPTMLKLAGLEPPAHMQGSPFIGPNTALPRKYVFAARDRMDERMDIVRMVRDERYRYLRNYEPHKPYAQNIDYMNQGPTMKELRKRKAEGTLPEAAKLFMSDTKPVEELYDTAVDPHETRNLAKDPEHSRVLGRMRAVHQLWMEETRDVGLIPEPVLADLEAKHGSRYAAMRAPGMDSKLKELRTLVDAVNHRGNDALVRKSLRHPDEAFRYWSLLRFAYSPEDAKANAEAIKQGLQDSSPVVRIVAARASGNVAMLAKELANPNVYVRLHAATALDDLGPKSAEAKQAMMDAKDEGQFDYVVRVCQHALGQL